MIRDPLSGPPERGMVRVRLMRGRDTSPYAEFQLSEADMADRIRPEDRGTRRATVAYQAAETARAGDASMGIGALAEVVLHSGARSLWIAAPWDWELLERRSAEGRLQRTRVATELESAHREEEAQADR